MRSVTGLGWIVAAGLALLACSETSDGGVATERTAAACTNDADDDGDGYTDCDDQDCWAFAVCQGGDADASDVFDDVSGDTSGASDDTATPGDGSVGDTGGGATCEPCGTGTLTGKVCAPSENVFVNDALVVVEGVDCDGAAFHRETRSSADGAWTLTGVPCGSHTVTITKGSFARIFQVTVATGETTDLSGAATKQCFQAGGTPIAVLDGAYDDIGVLLIQLGIAFDEYTDDGTGDGDIVAFLSDPSALAGYDIVFVNCGGTHGWMPQDHPEVMQHVKDWVLAGGSLYMSDYGWTYGEWSFPDAIEFQQNDSVYSMGSSDSPQLIPGDVTLTATVADGNMAAYLGKTTMSVTFDQGPQIAPEAAGAGTFAHVVGTFGPLVGLGTGFNGQNVPLVLSYVPSTGAGRVVYTNFHNDAQATSDMLTLLHYLVFTL
ncbi:MAG: carboxypeptidase regulatory-like domain-containing protein [Deltaproteobacteria bacterium]|nr:MAG: carboxypeptidase regulatory-like domain-containing protein [Deltaproteobacteria bacterium]